MKLAVISDIHSNYEALAAVMEDIRSRQVRKIISLGDNIGYGADPDMVITCLKKHDVLSVMGNHEMALHDTVCRRTFNPFALQALEINAALMSEASKKFTLNLDRFTVWHNARFVHGMPPDSVTTYILRLSDTRITRCIRSISQPVTFIGHTHQSRLYELTPAGLTKKSFPKNTVLLAKTNRYIINCPSVGQPRDGYNKARYIIWDTGENTLEHRFIPYDTQAALEKMKKAGIPKVYTLMFEAVQAKTPT